MDDREIMQWNKRLADQVQRGWDNYKHLHIDLSKANIDEPIRISGEYLYVEERSSVAAVAKIKLNRNTNDALDLEKGVIIETVFIEVYITNDALEDEWIDLVFGINFKYKKKIISPAEIDGALNFLTGGPITTPPGVDLTILTGAGGYAIFDSMVRFNQTFLVYGNFFRYGTNGSYLAFQYSTEEVTIPVGQGAAGVVSGTNLARADNLIMGVSCRVTQQPGGGATTLDIGRTGAGNLDEFIDGIATALGTTGTFSANHDAITLGPILNEIDRTFTLTTDADVLVSDMKVRICVFRWNEAPPSS